MAGVPPSLLDIAAGRPVSTLGDPDIVLDAAKAHGVSGLVWSRVLDGEVELPRDRAVALATADIEIRERHARLTRALLELTELLDARGIDTATFKGVTAERRWYDRPGERPCADIDLLLAPDCASRLGETVDLLDRRYPRRAGLERRVEMGLQQAATVDFGGVTVDLHVEVPKFGVPSRARSAVWQRVETTQLDDGAEVRVLDAEGHLFAFLANLVKDRFARLLTFSDIRRVAASDGLDW